MTVPETVWLPPTNKAPPTDIWPFGTFKLPPKQEDWPEEYGVMKLETVPRGILRQHLMPFQGGRKFDEYVD